MARSAGLKNRRLTPARLFGPYWRSLAMLVVGVVALHAWLLHGLARALSSMEPASATGPVFIARTLVLEAPTRTDAPLLAPEPSQTVVQPQAARRPPARPEKAPKADAPEQDLSAPPVAVSVSTQDAPESVQAATTVLAQRTAEPPPSAPAGASVRSVSTGMPDYDYLVPGSVRLKYKGSGTKGFLALPVSAELLWVKDGKSYDARLELGLLGFTRVQTSKGAVGPRGLEPLRFGDKTRSEEAAHFQRAKGIVSFSGNGPDAPLMPLAQDLLSVYVQLASMWGANPARFSPGTQLPFQLVEKHRSGSRVFTVAATERLTMAGRDMVATRLVCDPSAEYDNRVEVWLAPALEYLPARIRMTQANGDEVDIFWSSSEKP